MTTPGRLRVLIADDHLIVRLGLVSLIDSQPDMQVVAQAASGEEAVAQFRAHRPDVTLVDLRMPAADGVFAIEAIREIDPSAAVLVLTIYKGDDAVFRALQAGARGYLLKDVAGDELLEAIRTVHAGGSWIPAEIADRAAARVGQTPLSAREVEVLKLVARGLSNKRIADRLGLGESTVRTHVASLMEKLGADNRTHAVNVALERSIIEPVDLTGGGRND